jgi:hypothetical protein
MTDTCFDSPDDDDTEFLREAGLEVPPREQVRSRLVRAIRLLGFPDGRKLPKVTLDTVCSLRGDVMACGGGVLWARIAGIEQLPVCARHRSAAVTIGLTVELLEDKDGPVVMRLQRLDAVVR